MTTRDRLALTSLVALCGVMMIACGFVPPPDCDFLDKFPAGRKLCNKDRTQIIKAFHFHDGASTGEVTVTFGDAEEQFKIPGSFAFTEMTKARSPSAKLTITY